MKISKLNFFLIVIIVFGVCALIAQPNVREAIRTGILKGLDKAKETLDQPVSVGSVPVPEAFASPDENPLNLERPDEPEASVAPEAIDPPSSPSSVQSPKPTVIKLKETKATSKKQEMGTRETSEGTSQVSKIDATQTKTTSKPAPEKTPTASDVEDDVEVDEETPPEDETVTDASTESTTLPKDFEYLKEGSTLLRYYLSGDLDDVQSRAQQLLKTLGNAPNMEPLRALCKHIGSEKMPAQSLYEATQGDAGVCALAFMTLFLDAVQSRNISESRQSEVITFLDHYEANANLSKDKYVQYYMRRLDIWRKWVRDGANSTKTMERIFNYEGNFKNLNAVGKTRFVKFYDAITNRPELDALQFDMESAKTYLKGISNPVVQRSENLRMARFGKQRENITTLLKSMPYKGRMVLKSGLRTGTILSADANGFKLKTLSSKNNVVAWDDCKLEMFADMFDYFVKQTLKKNKELRGSTVPDMYISIAVIHLFAGNSEKAYTYAVKAEKADPVAAETIRKMFADVCEDISE